MPYGRESQDFIEISEYILSILLLIVYKYIRVATTSIMNVPIIMSVFVLIILLYLFYIFFNSISVIILPPFSSRNSNIVFVQNPAIDIKNADSHIS